MQKEELEENGDGLVYKGRPAKGGPAKGKRTKVKKGLGGRVSGPGGQGGPDPVPSVGRELKPWKEENLKESDLYDIVQEVLQNMLK